MKKIIASVLLMIFLTSNANAVDLYVGFSRLDTDTPPTIVDGRMLVPLRAIFEALGANVVWNPDTRTATAYHLYDPIAIQIDSNIAYINGKPQTLDVPAQLIDGCTMVPARFIAEALRFEVSWHQETQTAAIESNLSNESLYVTEDQDIFHYSDSCADNTYKATWAEILGRKMQPCDECVPFMIKTLYQPNFNAQKTDGDISEAEPPTPTTAENGTTSITVVPETSTAGSTAGNSGGNTSSDSVSSGENSTTNEITGSANRTVYWVPGGKSYHFSSNCRSLSRSKNIRKGTLQDALKAGKSDPCNNCAGGR